MKQMVNALVALLAVGLGSTGMAKNLTLTGNGSPAIWDIGSTAVWTDGTSATTFANGDNVTIDDMFTGASLMMNARVTPGSVVFDISRDITFGWGSSTSYGLGIDTHSFTKRGTGTLILSSSLSGDAKNASGDERYGNALTCGVEVVAGTLALKDRNSHNFLGPRTRPFWVYVRNGGALDFRQGNQTGSLGYGAGACVQLDAGSTLYHVTNNVTSADIESVLNLSVLRFCGGDFVNGNKTYYKGPNNSGNHTICLKLFKGLEFSGSTPHAFCCTNGTDAGYKPYTLASTFKGFPILVAPESTLEVRVDDITGDDKPDAYFALQPFVWRTNETVASRCTFMKTGPGYMVVPKGDTFESSKYYGRFDFTVAGGVTEFTQQGHFDCLPSLPQSTITVSNNATLFLSIRNVVKGTAIDRPNVKIVVDHGTFKYVTGTGNHGCLRAGEWVFDDATLDIRNAGMSRQFGVLGFLGPVTFRGTKPVAIKPCSDFADTYQAVHVYNNPRTVFTVADMTGDAQTDVTIGMKIYNAATNLATSGEMPDCGFVKAGPGTLAVTHKTNLVSGDVTVSGGVLRVDGVLTSPASIAVEAGGALGGTGTVKNVTLAAGGGFAVRASDAGNLLTIQGNLALPSSGVVIMDGTDASARVTFARVTGSITGADLSGWQIRRPDGTVVLKSDGLWFRDGYLHAGLRRGTILVVR